MGIVDCRILGFFGQASYGRKHLNSLVMDVVGSFQGRESVTP